MIGLHSYYSIITPKWGKMRVNEGQISKISKCYEVIHQTTGHVALSQNICSLYCIEYY